MTTVVLGGTTFDLLVSGVDAFPAADGTDEFTAQSLVELAATPVASMGGNAGNAAIALARLGCPTRLVTPLGQDVYGRLLTGWLREAGCLIDRIPSRETSVNIVATDVAGRRVSYFRPVAIDAVAALDRLQRVPMSLGGQLLLTGYPHADGEVLQHWAAAAREAGAAVALDIGPSLAGFDSGRLRPLLPLLDTIFGNRTELSALDPVDLARRLRDGVVVKDGANGAEHLGPDGSHVAVAAFAVRTASTVGAGDVFNAGYLCALREHATPEHRLRFAAATAALMLRNGSGSSMTPARSVVDKFLTHAENGEQS